MNSLPPRRPAPALVISLIALLMMMGGTGYAALKLPRNSFGASQIRPDVPGSALYRHLDGGRALSQGTRMTEKPRSR